MVWRPASAVARPAPRPLVSRPLPPPIAGTDQSLRHLAWVWQFRHDGDRADVARVLADHRLGIALKTHDGTDWMSTYDPTPDAVSGPDRVAELAAFFEAAGVPFHAWCVVQGIDPLAEAQMAAAVLGAGARSLFIDLEPHTGFWRGSAQSAAQYGEELRRLQPQAWLSTSIDPRPWEIDRIPLAQFAAFTDELSPQVYWGAFDTAPNVAKYVRAGEDPAEEGITPRFVLDVAMRKLRDYEMRIHPIGDGTVAEEDGWTQFIERSFDYEAEAVSVWRFGVADERIWELLRATPPRPLTYAVQPGDTLSALAEQWGTDVATISAVNGIADPDFLWVGQPLRIPRGVAVRPPARYTVQPGDNLTLLAGRWDTTVDEIVRVNGIADPDLLSIGQELLLP